MSWSISVKTVGGAIPPSLTDSPSSTESETESSLSTEKPKPTNFVVKVEPDDFISSLHEKIEDMTGLKTSQQRLIYRGRIISGGLKKADESHEDDTAALDENGSRLRDVAGLGDGQTIHLVPRPVESNPASSNSTSEASSQNSSSNLPTNDSGNASIELLAALLGIGSGGLSGDNDDNEDGSNAENDLGSLFSLPRTRSARSSARRRRANSHRRTANDPRYPEPGSLEPVRQGMMTLHTMANSIRSPPGMNEAAGDRTTDEENERRRPFDAVRSWYRGQWLDCRDTVNQWLEATVVDIVKPKDILNSVHSDHRSLEDSKIPAADPAVGANDFEGRRRLLLKMTENESDDELSKVNGSDEDLIGFRERDNNQHVQLLLIHYNGWPHRWDEWIRSDSERIRPFRTRSRHNPNRSNYANPTPQSVFHASPPTFFKDENETLERAALLPELCRMLTSINNLVSEAIPAEVHEKLTTDSTNTFQKDQPWMNHGENNMTMKNDEDDDCAEKTDDDKCDHDSQQVKKFDRKKLETLAPLLDRLGRTLTDAAPHIAAFAESLPEMQTKASAELVSASESELKTPSSNMQTSIVSTDDTATAPLLPTSTAESMRTEDDPEIERVDENDPDYIDFVNGFINVSTNDRMMSGRNSSRRLERVEEGPSSIGSSLLSAYLASSGSSNSNNDNNGEDGTGNSDENSNGNSRGPRVVRFGNSNNDGGALGPGIDIHIHAIVTGPGGGVATTGGGGLAGLAALGLPMNLAATTPIRSTTTLTPTTTMVTPTMQHEEDDGLFSDLYSESPAPIDLSSNLSSISRVDSSTNQNSTAESMDIEENNDSISESELDPLPALEPTTMFPGTVEPTNETLYLLEDRSTGRNLDDLEPNSMIVDENESSLNESNSTRSSGEPRTAFGRFFRRALGRRHHSSNI